MWSVTLVLLGLAHADDWDLEVRATLSDHLDAEALIRDKQVPSQHASVLAGRVDASGERMLSWQEADGNVILSPLKHREQGTVCAQLEGRDRISGPREVVLYRTTNDDARDAEAILISGEDADQVMVSLRPGEQVLTITVSDDIGVPQAEYLEVSRERGRLQMVREGQGAVTCYTGIDIAQAE